MYPKTKFTAQIGLTYAISLLKYFCFGIFILESISCYFFAKFELLMFHNNIVNISENLKNRHSLKIGL